jgi:hypothetical protein
MTVQMAPDNVAAASLAVKTADGKTMSARESFGGILAVARLAKSMYAERYGMSEEASAEAGKIENFAESLSDENLSLLIAPISNGVERMRDFADALDAELSEGDVRGAIDLAGKAVEKVSRFDPDMILGDVAGGSIHKLIEEFLKKFSAAGTAKPQQQILPKEENSDELTYDLTLLDAGEDALPLPDAPEPDEIPLAPDASASPETPEIPYEPDLADLPKLPDDAEIIVKTDSSDEDDPAASETETAAPERAVLNAAFAEILKARDDSRGGGTDDEAARPDLDKTRDGEGLTRGLAKAASPVFKEGKTERAVPGVKPEDISSAKPDSFASALASETRANSAPNEQKTELPPATLPGSTYELRGSNLLGNGVSSVLEFMRNDGINEARIVVEPPALGRVDVSLQASGSGVEAVFKVDNEALKQILQQQLDLLKTSLEAQGIHVSNLAVDIKNREDQKGRSDLYDGKRKIHGADGIAGDDEDEPRTARIDLERGLLHWVA